MEMYTLWLAKERQTLVRVNDERPPYLRRCMCTVLFMYWIERPTGFSEISHRSLSLRVSIQCFEVGDSEVLKNFIPNPHHHLT